MWNILKKNRTIKTPIFDVDYTEKEKDGKIGEFVSLNAPDWVSAIVINKSNGKYVMVKEFRHGINDYIYEFPSGTVEKGETSEEAIVRELKEEIGAENIKIVGKLFTGNPNTAFMNNKITSYFVEVSSIGKQSLDKFEDLTVEEFDASGMYEKITERSSISQQLALSEYINN